MDRIHLSADLGEGTENDELMMPYLSSCNIACGGHFGDKYSIRSAILCAKKHGVDIGAHPSYPDKKNFGRVAMNISDTDLKQSLVSQLVTIKKIAEEEGSPIRHVKAHGALYHQIVKDVTIRKVYFDSVNEVFSKIKVVLPLHTNAEAIGVDETSIIFESFGDRKYDDSLQLVARSESNAILESVEDITDQVCRLFIENKVKTISGALVDIEHQTICLHGDHPNLSTYFPLFISILKSKNIKV